MTPFAAVIGAGPAGLIAAEILGRAGLSVTVFDRMPRPARKFLLAGRGGLNLTHSTEMPRFLAAYRAGSCAPLVRDAVTRFPPGELIAWCHGLGIETFTGTSGRVFPTALKASPLLRAWLRRLEGLNVTFRGGLAWRGWDEAGQLVFDNPDDQSTAVCPDVTVLALGGASWPRLGATGDWLGMLQADGAAAVPFSASNAGVLVAWSSHLIERHAGAPLKRVVVNCLGRSVPGDLVITASGLEGGPVYGLSPEIRTMVDARRTDAGAATPALSIDLRPDVSVDKLASRLARPRGGQSLANHLRKAAGLSPPMIALLREPMTGALPSEPQDLAARIKSLAVPVADVAGLERAISSVGGIERSALTDDFMLVHRPGVFAAGEMLDWDAPTGGWLLQACFATGIAAAQAAAAYALAGGYTTDGAAVSVLEPVSGDQQ